MADSSDTQPSPEHAFKRGRSCLSADELLDFVQGRLDPEHRDALHAHVDRCSTCQELVNEAAHAMSNESGSPDSAALNMFQPGDVIAQRYRVQRFVARGGMGEVYEVYDRELEERVALKTVLASVADSPRAERRLRVEVQLARRIGHPNVCRIFDLGTHQLEKSGAQLNFLTMEFVEGERLGERIERGRLPLAEAERLGRQLLEGLCAAHDAGVLHRDFKSDNVMLRPSPSGEVVPVIMDFGLARPMDANAARLTSGANHAFVGTPCYMAPEQLEGQPLSMATDVYAFGVVWFEMLTGELPFRLSAPFERLSKPPLSPSSLAPEVSERIDRIVLRCLSRLPKERYSSAAEVLAALDGPDAESAPQGVSLPPASPASPASTVRRARPERRWAMLSVGAFSVIAAGALLLGATRPHAATSKAAEPQVTISKAEPAKPQELEPRPLDGNDQKTNARSAPEPEGPTRGQASAPDPVPVATQRSAQPPQPAAPASPRKPNTTPSRTPAPDQSKSGAPSLPASGASSSPSAAPPPAAAPTPPRTTGPPTSDWLNPWEKRSDSNDKPEPTPQN